MVVWEIWLECCCLQLGSGHNPRISRSDFKHFKDFMSGPLVRLCVPYDLNGSVHERCLSKLSV